MDALAQLKELTAEIIDLRAAQGLLGWDLETYMPPEGAETRAHQRSTLAKLSHQMLTSETMGNLLKTLRKQKLDRIDQALVREVAKEYDRETKIPVKLVQEMTEVTAKAHPIWVSARKDNKFSNFAPVLEKIIDLNRQTTKVIGYQDSPYNALLDLYEPTLTVKQTDTLFSALKKDLVPLVKAIQESPKKPDAGFLRNKTYPEDKQWEFTITVLEAMGFDFARGRQDKAAHPFTMGMSSRDVRLTTRVFKTDIVSALFSSLHEGGHGLYEQGVDPALARTFLDGGVSLGIHESQSRLWENLVGRSKAFWTYFYPKLKKLFPKPLDGITMQQFYKAINTVEPSFIRVEADEVTYNLHIMLRYEIEKALIEGDLKVKDIPAVWNKNMKSYLGITPPSDTLGCLQDVHWSHGSFGYFPTYTLGNLHSVQFFNTAKKQVKSLEDQIAKGKLLPLKNWLNQEIHHHGHVELPDELSRRVTGEPLNSRYFVEYLWAKYGEIYGIK